MKKQVLSWFAYVLGVGGGIPFNSLNALQITCDFSYTIAHPFSCCCCFLLLLSHIYIFSLITPQIILPMLSLSLFLMLALLIRKKDVAPILGSQSSNWDFANFCRSVLSNLALSYRPLQLQVMPLFHLHPNHFLLAQKYLVLYLTVLLPYPQVSYPRQATRTGKSRLGISDFNRNKQFYSARYQNTCNLGELIQFSYIV